MSTDTGSAHFYEVKVLEIVARLESDTSTEGLRIKTEGERLIALFQTWPTTKPSYDDRIAAMKSLFDLNRALLEHVEGKTPKADGDDDGSKNQDW